MVYYQRYYLRMLVSLPSHMKENQIYRNLCLLNCEHGRNRKFVIVQDQDTGDCRELKRKLVELCGDTTQEVLIRIACHELEAWYFGDLEAVSKAYGKNITVLAKKKQYRVPDDIISPKRELKKYLPEHQQISGAKRIAQYIDINRNTSESFQALVSGVRKLIS